MWQTSNSNSVSIIDIATNTVIDTVSVGSGPTGISATPDGTKVYVTNYGSSTVSVIDTETKKVTATVNVGNLLLEQQSIRRELRYILRTTTTTLFL